MLRSFGPHKGRAESRIHRAPLAAAILGVAGCHEVLALDPLPFPNASAAILAAEPPDDGPPRLAIDAVPLTRNPSFVLGSEDQVWAFAFACDLDRLQLTPSERVPSEVPLLPPPSESWAWGDGWAPTALEAAPPAIRSIFAEASAPEPCATYANRLLPGPPTPSSDLALDGLEAFGSSLIQIAPDFEGGAWLAQSTLEIQEERFVRIGGRVFHADDSGEFERAADWAGPTTALVARGPDELVAAGEGGLFRGPAERLARVDGIGRLEDAAVLRIASSPAGAPFEAFLIGFDAYPAADSSTVTMTLGHLDEAGFRVLAGPAEVEAGDRLRVPQVVWTGPGEGWAIGFEEDGVATRIRDGRLIPLRIDGSAATLQALRVHAEVGVMATDVQGQTFVRAPGGAEDRPWTKLDGISRGLGPVFGTVVDEVPAVALLREGPVEEGGGLSFVYLRPSGACPTNALDIRAQDFVSDALASEAVVALEVSEGQFWAVHVRFSIFAGSSSRTRVDMFEVDSPLGLCSAPL
ncbi:MAG: hypothetical protein AAFU79_03375 [Myxococcota bacterium]